MESGNVVDVIRDTLEAKMIKYVDLSIAPRYMKYVLFWA